jgi:hypothetical protein
MRRQLVAIALVAFVVAALLVPYYLTEQGKQRAIEFVKHYNGVDRKGPSISDYVSLTDAGCSCGGAGPVSQSWQAEPSGQPNVWRVVDKAKTTLRTTQFLFYTDTVTVWAGNDEAEKIIGQVNA